MIRPDLGPLHDARDILEAFREQYPAASDADLDFYISSIGMIFLDWADQESTRRFRVMYDGYCYDFEEVEP